MSSSVEEAIKYRTPLPVADAKKFPNGYVFPVCPRCRITLEREYQSYCDRCGQCLDWKNFRNANVIEVE